MRDKTEYYAAVVKRLIRIRLPTDFGFPGSSMVKNLPALKEMREDPLEEEMATHSSILS